MTAKHNATIMRSLRTLSRTLPGAIATTVLGQRLKTAISMCHFFHGRQVIDAHWRCVLVECGLDVTNARRSREERVKPRSIVFDLFGDYIRYRGGAVRLRTLSALMGCFGVGESTVRVVIARLRKEGWFDAERDGRETLYTLNHKSLRMLDEGRDRIFNRVRTEWDRHWYLVIYS